MRGTLTLIPVDSGMGAVFTAEKYSDVYIGGTKHSASLYLQAAANATQPELPKLLTVLLRSKRHLLPQLLRVRCITGSRTIPINRGAAIRCLRP